MNEPVLLFCQNKTSVYIQFANGKESDIYDTPQALAFELEAMIRRGRITFEQAFRLLKEAALGSSQKKKVGFITSIGHFSFN